MCVICCIYIMLESLSHIQYCYSIVMNQISIGLLLYAHLPAAILALLFGSFLLYKSPNTVGRYFFGVCVGFAVWVLLNLMSWFVFIGDSVMMFSWSLIDLFALIFFVYSYAFAYAFIVRADVPMWQKLVAVGLVLPTAIWTLLGQNLVLFDANGCQAVEDRMVTLYPYFIQGIVLIGVFVQALLSYRSASDRNRKNEILFFGVGMLIFLGFFFASTLGTKILVDETALSYAYNFEIYGLFGMPILLALLGYLIVRYKSFNIKVFGAQALVFALIATIASELAFVQSTTNQILVSVTLLLSCWFGLQLIRSVKREIQHREEIERLAVELDKTNGRQETLIHFIGHEVKGFLTKDAGAFAALSEGDFGALSADAKRFVDEALEQTRRGVESVSYILKASDLKKGTVHYMHQPFDFKALVEESVAAAKSSAERRGLALTLTVDDGEYTMVGDQPQIKDHVLRNVIENSIYYTQSGSITVHLSRNNNKLVCTVTDTGVGISADDMKVLFTEGGHGKDSIKVNAHSTGYGLYITQQVAQAMGGTVRAASAGEGKGSTFTLEFPAA